MGLQSETFKVSLYNPEPEGKPGSTNSTQCNQYTFEEQKI